MICEIIPEAYNAEGNLVSKPRWKRHRFVDPTFPLGLHLKKPLAVHCADLAELTAFLKDCRYVSDREQFGKNDYWLAPEKFEIRKKGDCEDFALWTWRQLMEMGYPARFVCGYAGLFNSGHAWVTYVHDGKTYLMEPTAPSFFWRFPRLYCLRYKPMVSVEWDGKKIRYYDHEPREYRPSLLELMRLLPGWLLFSALRYRYLLRLLLFPLWLLFYLLRWLRKTWRERT